MPREPDDLRRQRNEVGRIGLYYVLVAVPLFVVGVTLGPASVWVLVAFLLTVGPIHFWRRRERKRP